jgi:hypothetical protein
VEKPQPATLLAVSYQLSAISKNNPARARDWRIRAFGSKRADVGSLKADR